MLLQFSVSNYGSIKNEVLFSMVPSTDKSHPENLVVSGKYKLEQVEPDDSLTYVVKRALGSNGCTLVIGCEKYQTVNNDTLYTAYLSYHDSALEENEDSDEL